MNITIRAVHTGDADGIVRVLNPIIEAGTYTVFDTPFTVAEERAYIARFPSRGVFLAAIDSTDRIVGFQSMEPFATYTRAFDHVGVVGTYVDLSCRRRGIARRLFAATYEVCASKGYEKIFTFIRGDNPAALATYQSQGFEVVGTARRHARLPDPPTRRYVDEIIVEKLL